MVIFCANLAWTAFRTRCYDLVSRYEGVAYLPHPLRARIAGFSSSSDYVSSYNPEQQEAYVRLYIDTLEKVHQEALDSLSNLINTILLKFPYSTMLPHVIKLAKEKEKIIEAAYEVRESNGARDLRQHISRIETEIFSGNVKSAIELTTEIKELMTILKQDIGIEDPSMPNLTISIAGIVSMDVPKRLIPKSLIKKKTFAKPRLSFLRNVFDDLSRAASLGSLYEVLYEAPTKVTPTSLLVEPLAELKEQIERSEKSRTIQVPDEQGTSRSSPPVPKTAEQLGHNISETNGICRKCGSSQPAIEHFQWKCKMSDLLL